MASKLLSISVRVEDTVRQMASSQSHGLSNLPYELYKVLRPLAGPHLLAALNGMLEAGELDLVQGVGSLHL